MSLDNLMHSRICIVNRGLQVSPWLAKCLATVVFMVSDFEEMIPKPIQYSIFGLTHILYIADIVFQAIFEIILDGIKYGDHSRWYKKYLQEVIPPFGGGTFNWRWDLQSEVGPQIGGETSIWRWDLQLEVRPPFGGETSDWQWHLQLEVRPPFGAGTSNQRWDWLEVGPPFGGETSNSEVRAPNGGLSSNWRSFLLWLSKK